MRISKRDAAPGRCPLLVLASKYTMNTTLTSILRASLICLLSTQALLACSIRWNWPRHAIDVVATAQVRASEPIMLEVMTGELVEVKEAKIVLSAVEFLTCDEYERPNLPGFSLRRLLLGEAHAHGPTTPTRIGTPHAIDLLDGAHSLQIGQFQPPPGEYCALRLHFGQGDDDVLGLADPAELEGTSLRIRAHGVELETGAAFDTTHIFESPWVFGDESDQQASLTIALNTHDTFAVMPMLEEDPERRARMALMQAAQTITVEVEQ